MVHLSTAVITTVISFIAGAVVFYLYGKKVGSAIAQEAHKLANKLG